MKLLSHIFRIVCMAALIAGTGLSTNPADHVHAAVELLGATITVTTVADNTTADTLCSLREAITNANDDAPIFPECQAGSGNDTITFTNSSPITITLDSPLPDITDSDGLTINGGADVTLSGNTAHRIFFVGNSAVLVLESISLRDGKITGSSGGAIQNGGRLTISNSHFDNNDAEFGGAIYSTGRLNVTNSSFQTNSSMMGGNAILTTGQMTIINSTFAHNLSTGDSRGTIFNAGMGSTITNSTFYNNSSAGIAGAIYNEEMLTITNSTFSSNSSAVLGAADIYQDLTFSVLTLQNNILADAQAGSHCVIADGLVSGSNNLIQKASTACGFTNGINGNIIGSDPAIGTSLSGNAPSYLILNPDSPAIDAGDDATCPVTDQRGVMRPQGSHCDIGAYEKIPPDSVILVTTNEDNTTTDSFCSLPEAITNANHNAPTFPDCAPGSEHDTIIFSNSVNMITLGSALPNITEFNDLTIQGGDDVIINGNDTVQIFNILENSTLTLESITLKNGNSDSYGGGIANSGTLTIRNSALLENSSSGYGGGIANGGTLTITNSTFTGNHSFDSGGAIDNAGIQGILTITNSTFSDNSSAAGSGGSIFNGYKGTMTMVSNSFTDNTSMFSTIVNDSVSSATIANSTFYNNDSGVGKGIIQNDGEMIVANNTFSNNNPSGGMDIVTSGNLNLYNNIFANNLGGGHCADFGQGTISASNNLMEGTINICDLINGVDGNIIGSDPALGTLSGSPAYLPLNIGSAAIDAGDDAICAAAPVSNTSQNGLIRPKGAHCDIGSFEYLPTITFILNSSGANDGWILESTETSGRGSLMNSAATTFNLGDDLLDRQYRAILHFDTSSLPDNAVIVSATLRIKRKGLAGTNPFTILGNLNASVRKPAFGTATLTLTDFKSAAGKNNVASFGVVPTGAWYSALINDTGKLYINLSGTTQFRLSFAKDDNNDNGNDYMKFHSGNAGFANRPQLIIEYTIP